MNLELNGKVAIITGGAKGIGGAISRTFAAEGAVACILGRSQAEADQLVQEITARGQRAVSFVCELTDESQVRAAVEQVLERYRGIDVLVNNAGVNDGVGLRAPAADFRASLERNLVHCYVLMQACLDALIASRGAIINIGTIRDGRYLPPQLPGYSIEMKPESLRDYSYPQGSAWKST